MADSIAEKGLQRMIRAIQQIKSINELFTTERLKVYTHLTRLILNKNWKIEMFGVLFLCECPIFSKVGQSPVDIHLLCLLSNRT